MRHGAVAYVAGCCDYLSLRHRVAFLNVGTVLFDMSVTGASAVSMINVNKVVRPMVPVAVIVLHHFYYLPGAGSANIGTYRHVKVIGELAGSTVADHAANPPARRSNQYLWARAINKATLRAAEIGTSPEDR